MIHAFLSIFPLSTPPGKDYSPEELRGKHPALSCTSLEEGEWTDPSRPPQILTASATRPAAWTMRGAAQKHGRSGKLQMAHLYSFPAS